MKNGFSLVELSIVLVILGLLTGGILAGQSLIRAAELRSVSTEYQRYVTATQAFRDKYFQLPGDMTNASSFWTGEVNGNGNGNLGYLVAEGVAYWRHLQLAGLIEGNLTGALDGANVYTISVNIPPSKVNNAGWSAFSILNPSVGLWPGACEMPIFDYGNVLAIGGNRANYWAMNGVMKPEEAWNIDTKLDDGVPVTGKVVGEWTSCITPNPSDCTSQFVPGTYNYALTVTTNACGVIFRRAF